MSDEMLRFTHVGQDGRAVDVRLRAVWPLPGAGATGPIGYLALCGCLAEVRDGGLFPRFCPTHTPRSHRAPETVTYEEICDRG